MKLTVLKLNILDSLNKCQYPYVLNLFSPGFEKSYPTSVKGEKKHYCRHCYIPWNVDRMQMCKSEKYTMTKFTFAQNRFLPENK